MIFPDLELARRMERREAEGAAAFCDAAKRLFPLDGVERLTVAGGECVYYGVDAILNGVKGLGVDGPVGGEDLDAIERFFLGRGTAAIVDLCPLAPVELFQSLLARGFTLRAFETVHYRELAEELPAKVEGVQVERVEGHDVELFSRVVERGFGNRELDDPHPADALALKIGKVCEKLDLTMLLAIVGGRLAGGASMSIKDGIAWFFGSATLPSMRGKRVQSALLVERLRIAREERCLVAKVDTLPGTTSQRNAIRAGFQVAYTRPQMSKSPGA